MTDRVGAPEVITLLLLGVGFIGYFLPTFIATLRRKTNVLPIMALNVLLGWTVLGWVVALVWALSTQMVDERMPRRL